jgi:hypothetical protein
MAGRIFGMIRHSEGNINCVVRERPRDSRAVVERYTGGKSFRAHLRRKPISLVTVPISTIPGMSVPKMADVVRFAKMTNAHGVSAKIG